MNGARSSTERTSWPSQPPSGRASGALTLGRPRALVVLACLLLLAGCGDDAATDVEPDPGPTIPAGGLGEGPYPVADLTVRYINPDVALDLTYRISCQGDTAAVTGDDVGVGEIEACTALTREAVVLRLLEGPPPGQVCTQIYGGADLARFTGTIDDRSVDAEVGRENGCAIADWDSLLTDLLPVPVGASPAPTTSDTTSPTISLSDGSAAAIATAGDYIDAVARGDLVLAWSFVAEPSREELGGFGEFEGLRSALSEGIGAWDSAEDVQVFASAVDGAGDAWAVTLLGVVALEGPPAPAATAMIVYTDTDPATVSPFEDAFGSSGFVSFDPPPGSELAAGQSIGIELPGDLESVTALIDGTTVDLVPDSSLSSRQQVVTEEALTPGLHAVTIIPRAAGGERTAVASAYLVP